MLTKAEQKEIEERANGKRIYFHTRHHWILTWIEEQPGQSLADKLWGVVNRAYQADYAARAQRAETRYLQCGVSDFDGRLAALSEAMECYSRAGNNKCYDELHTIITRIAWEKVKRDGAP